MSINYELFRELRKSHSKWLSGQGIVKIKDIDDITHKAFCEYLFFDNTKPIYLCLRPYIKSYYNWDDENHLSLFLSSNDSLAFGEKIKNRHIVVDPELLQLYINRYGNFLTYVFDLESCIFCFQDKKCNLSFLSNIKYYCYKKELVYYTCKYYNIHVVDYLSDSPLQKTSEKCQCGLLIDNISFSKKQKEISIRDITISYDKERAELEQYFEMYFMYIGYTKYKLIYNICIKTEKSGSERFMMDKKKQMMDLYNLDLEFKFCLLPSEINYFVEI